MEQRKGGPQLTPSSLEAASPWAEQCSRGCRNTAPKNRAGMGHRGKLLPRVPLGHLLPQHELLPRRMLFQFGLQGCNTCPELCLPSAPSPLHPPTLLAVWLLGEDMGTAHGATAEATGGGFTALVPPQDAPQTGYFSKQNTGRVLTRHGTARTKSTRTSPTERRAGSVGTESLWGWPLCHHEELALPFPSPSSYTHGRGQA